MLTTIPYPIKGKIVVNQASGMAKFYHIFAETENAI